MYLILELASNSPNSVVVVFKALYLLGGSALERKGENPLASLFHGVGEIE